ncbi:MAG: hypothetical protein RIR96_518 [Bacteroidota bacterium]|jgi:predicted DNA-binding protein (MmcQ/YjbR family)
MNVEEIREFAISLPDVTEGFPFGETVLVFKANQKMFLLLPLDESETQFNVKCDPDKAIEWREEFPEAVFPGYHMNKKHWNTVLSNATVSTKLQKEMIKMSYDLVAGKKKKT